MAFRGRHRFVLWLAGVGAALWLVIWRQTDSFRTARALADLRVQRAALEGRRSDFERRIRVATSRDALIPRAGARLGLRLPADSEIFRIPLPTTGAAAPR